jgi:hypothetical protein
MNVPNSKGDFAVEFGGKVHDFTVPLHKRLESRKFRGPYEMTPSKPDEPVGFYMASGEDFVCAKHGARIRLRLEDANLHFRRRRGCIVYRCNFDSEGFIPIVARLPGGRGFLAGWTMGAGMFSVLDRDIFDDAKDAACVAHSLAENAAERQAEFEAEYGADDTA